MAPYGKRPPFSEPLWFERVFQKPGGWVEGNVKRNRQKNHKKQNWCKENYPGVGLCCYFLRRFLDDQSLIITVNVRVY